MLLEEARFNHPAADFVAVDASDAGQPVLVMAKDEQQADPATLDEPGGDMESLSREVDPAPGEQSASDRGMLYDPLDAPYEEDWMSRFSAFHGV